jgi:hypothetical protein
MRRGRALFITVVCAALIAWGAVSGSCLDLGLQASTGNLGFRTDRSSADSTFPGADYFWGLSLSANQTISDRFAFEAGFYSDPVLRNISYALFSYNERVISIGVGPFFGFFNSSGTLLKSGISTSVKLELPGVVFVSFRADSSIGGELVQDGDYLQQRNDISIGFNVLNAICTLSLDNRTFEQKTTADKVSDSLTVYSFSTDIYQKNVPYRVIVTFAYQALSRAFVTGESTTTLNSLVIGTEVDITITSSLLLQAGIEGSVYSFGQGPLVGSAKDFLVRAFSGVKVNVDSLPFLSQLL